MADVSLLHVLRQHEDADAWLALADGESGPETVVGVRRWHPHVDDGEVGFVAANGDQQLVGVADGGNDILAGVGKDAGEAGAQQH